MERCGMPKDFGVEFVDPSPIRASGLDAGGLPSSAAVGFPARWGEHDPGGVRSHGRGVAKLPAGEDGARVGYQPQPPRPPDFVAKGVRSPFHSDVSRTVFRKVQWLIL